MCHYNGNAGLPRRQAHYITIRLPEGRTPDGSAVKFEVKDKVRVTGYVHDMPYRQSLHSFLTRLKQIDRIKEDDHDIRVYRLATYLTVASLIRFG